MFVRTTGAVLTGTGSGAAGFLKRSTVSQPPMSHPWRTCAEEGGTIMAPGLVRFGYGSQWAEPSYQPGGTMCTSDSFLGVDPAPGIRKVCECDTGPSDVGNNVAMARKSNGGHHRGSRRHMDELGDHWGWCSSEESKCDCKSGVIRFGSNLRWLSLELGRSAQGFPCTVASFGGDPHYGHSKDCWCRQAAAAGNHTARVALVTLSRRPVDLQVWMRYHFEVVGVSHIFLQVEDSAEATLNGTLATLAPEERARLTLWPPQGSMQAGQRPLDDYESLQKRQVLLMERGKEAAQSLGIDWLVHLDDDELLYSPSNRAVGNLLASLPTDINQAHIPNVEAIYKNSEVKHCFTETVEVNMNSVTFTSYANGKSAVRVADQAAYPAGPHLWRDGPHRETPSIRLDTLPFGTPLLVVHFESCPFSRWQEKFWTLANTSPEKIDAIPFPFYRDSIRTAQSCWGNSAPDASGSRDPQPECSRQTLQQLWARWKTRENPSYRAQDIMPLQIHWPASLATGSVH